MSTTTHGISVPRHEQDDLEALKRLRAAYDTMRAEIGRVVIGQDDVIEQLLIAVFARGHCLLVGVPGLAKTLLVCTLARILSLSFKRIQFTPDLMPADITGTEIIQEDPVTGERRFVFVHGPHLRQHDPGRRDQPHPAEDPGRAAGGDAGAPGHRRRADATSCRSRSSSWPPRTRSSRKAPTRCPRPSSTASCSTITVGYPSAEEELAIMRATTGGAATSSSTDALDAEEILALQEIVRRVPVGRPRLRVRGGLVPRHPARTSRGAPTSSKECVCWGAGPRASQYLILGAKARAVLHGRFYATTDDVAAVAAPGAAPPHPHQLQRRGRGHRPPTKIVDRLLEKTPRPTETEDALAAKQHHKRRRLWIQHRRVHSPLKWRRIRSNGFKRRHAEPVDRQSV